MNIDIGINLLGRIKKITTITYGYPISEDDVISMLEDLVNEYENLEEKYEDLEQDLQDNYRPIPVSEQVCISDRDFI